MKNKLNFKDRFRYLKLSTIKRLMPCGLMLPLLLLVGCVSLPNIEMKTPTDEIRITPGNNAIGVIVRTKTWTPSHQQDIIDADRSYAVSPSGTRYSLRFEKIEYVEKYQKRDPSPWFEREVYLNNPSKGNDVPWVKGNWELNLFFIEPASRPPIHAEFRLYTSWWFPLFERPF